MNRFSDMENTIFPVLAPTLAKVVRSAPTWLLEQASEIRLRAGQPVMMIAGCKDFQLSNDYRQAGGIASYYVCSRDDLAQTMQLISRNSLYAFEQELKLGFFTVAGGHRIGLAGQAIMDGGELKALKNISAMNIRLAREIRGVADLIMPYAVIKPNRVLSTLLIAPPRCGKTTLLRDMVRQLSNGITRLDFSGVQVGLVDERSEIAACRDGVATADLGPRVDVLDGCPKATGMLMLIRSMAPQVVITDELGRQADADAVREALHAGVSVIASVHGRDEEDILGRPFIGDLIRQKVFDRYVVLSDTPHIGTIVAIIAGKNSEVLYRRKKEVRECG
jgi:stage III sporulation protein AA